MNIKQLLEDEQQKKDRITAIQREISKNEKKLPVIQIEYKNSVAADSEYVDELFEEVEMIKRKLKADKHKLETLKDITKEHLKDNAYKVMENYSSEVEPTYKKRVEEVSEKIRNLKSEYINNAKKLQKEVIQINKEYCDVTRQHAKVMERNNLTKNELDTIENGLYKKLDNALYNDYDYIVSESVEVTKHNINTTGVMK